MVILGVSPGARLNELEVLDHGMAAGEADLANHARAFPPASARRERDAGIHDVRSAPSSPQRKSRCHHERRYSPSVTGLQADLFLFLDHAFDLAVFDRLDSAARSRLSRVWHAPASAAPVAASCRHGWRETAVWFVASRASRRSLAAGADLVLLAAGSFTRSILPICFWCQPAVLTHDDLGQILVHHDVAGDGIDHDRAARALERPALERASALSVSILPLSVCTTWTMAAMPS